MEARATGRRDAERGAVLRSVTHRVALQSEERMLDRLAGAAGRGERCARVLVFGACPIGEVQRRDVRLDEARVDAVSLTGLVQVRPHERPLVGEAVG